MKSRSSRSAGHEGPRRLVEERGRTGELLRQFAESTATPEAPRRSFSAVLAGRAERPRPSRVALFAGAVATACAAGALAFFLRTAPSSPDREVTSTLPVPGALAVDPEPAPSVRPAPPAAAPAPRPPRVLALTRTRAPLEVGETAVLDEAVVALPTGSRAEAARTREGAAIWLRHGRVGLTVVPRATRPPLFVNAGPYRFTVVGTAFDVTVDEARVSLEVTEGKVRVSRGGRALGLVVAPGTWSGGLTPAATRPGPRSAAGGPGARGATPPVPLAQPAQALARPVAEAPAPASTDAPPTEQVAASVRRGSPAPTDRAPAAPVATVEGAAAAPPACKDAAHAHRLDEALACYERQAARGGLEAETALYEIARLRAQRLGDLQGALRAFEEHRRRFPVGALRTEVELSLVELLPRVGQDERALTESARLLAAGPPRAVAADLHVLRGNIYRERRRDWARAEREYAQAAEFEGKSCDDARFYRASMLEQLGRRAEAAAAYRTYLERGGRHAPEARRRLTALEGR